LQVKKLALPNSAYITNTYDSVARLLSTELLNSGNTILNAHVYGYNVGNQRTNQTFLNNNYENYTYDNIGQLTSALGAESGGATNRLQEQLKYAYDAAHNLNIRTNNALVQNFNVNDLNELSNVTRTGTLTVAGTVGEGSSAGNPVSVTVSGSGAAAVYNDWTWARTNVTITNGNNTYTATASDNLGRSSANSVSVYLPTNTVFTYDLNGNPLSDGYRTFTYDDENELTSVVVSNGITTSTLTSNIYDGKMRLRIRREYTWSSGWLQTAEVHYVYDGNLVIQERDANNLPTVSYTRGKDLSGSLQGAGGIGGLLARSDMALTINSQLSTSPHSYYHCDGNGNITALINSLQLIVARYEYDPYGNVLSLSGPLAGANVYRFSSKEFLQNSGLIYYLYRFYDPNLQRWMTRDPIAEEGGDNLYVFSRNEPEANEDLFGLNCRKTLTYEFLAPDDVGYFEPSDAVYVKSVDDIIDDLSKQIQQYDPEGNCCKGKCIQEIIISAHGTGPGNLTLGKLYFDSQSAFFADTPDSELARKRQLLKAEYVSARAALQSIAKAAQGKMCTGGTICFLVCGAGGGPQGADLQGQLEGIFAGDNVETFTEGAAFYPFGVPGTVPGKKK
jgi:RHS repeat-associated protein